MSYYAAEEEDEIYHPGTPVGTSSPRRGSSKHRSSRSRSSKRRSSKSETLVEAETPHYADGDEEDDDVVMSPPSEERRRARQLQAKRDEALSRSSRELKLRAKFSQDAGAVPHSPSHRVRASKSSSSPRKSPKKKSPRRKSRQEKVYDDLYGTEYHEVDDGIVGCADALCVNHKDLVEIAGAIKKEDDDDDISDGAFQKFKSPNNGKDNKPVDDSEEVYIVRQRYGYFSIFFGVIQCIVLALMMWQCGVAPMNINPMFGPYPDALSEWGGKNSILIVEDGEWWRLITPILLHAGVIHLFCNVAVQLELGVFFEREWGSMTWLIIYLSSAVGSSVLSVVTMPDAVSVGSSGAVMGLFGGKLAEIICRACEKSDTAQDRVAHQVRKEQCIGVSCSVVVVLAFSFIPYVDWAAHLGGLLAGFFVGLMTFSVHMESYCLRLLWFLIGTGLTLGFIVPCIDIMYSGDVPMNEELRDVCGYYTQNFDDYECNCMREEYIANYGFWNKDDDAQGGGGGDDDGNNGAQRLLYQLSEYYKGRHY